MHFKHIILTTTCLFTSALAIAQLPQDSRRPGGIAVVPLSTDITQVTFQQKPVLISQEGQQ
ncbi:M23 family peptidase, partial [Acinetobacter sp. A11]